MGGENQCTLVGQDSAVKTVYLKSWYFLIIVMIYTQANIPIYCRTQSTVADKKYCI